MTAAVGIEVPTAVARLVAGARTGGGGALVVRGGSEQARVAVLTAAQAAAGDVLDLRTTGVGRSPAARRRPAPAAAPLAPRVGALPAPQAAELARVLGRAAAEWTGWCSAPRCSTC